MLKLLHEVLNTYDFVLISNFVEAFSIWSSSSDSLNEIFNVLIIKNIFFCQGFLRRSLKKVAFRCSGYFFRQR